MNLGITISNSEAEDEHGHLRFKGDQVNLRMTFLDSEAKDEHGHKRWRDQGPHNLQPHVFIMEIMKQDFV